MRIGTSGWSYPSWKGTFYPVRTPPAKMLGLYSQTFTAVEAHSTHRQAPRGPALARWAEQVPDGFRFVAKAHAAITHRRDIEGTGERVAGFLDALGPLGDRMGPVLYVLPHLKPDLARLDLLLAAIGAGGARPGGVLELGPQWWVDDVLDRLADVPAAALAVVDRDDPGTGGGPALDQPALRRPAPGAVAYFRLRRAAYDEAGLDRWAERLANEAAGGRDVYAFVKHDEHGDGPRYAHGLVSRLEGV